MAAWDSPESTIMTKLVEKAIAAISKLPPETQDDLARFMLALASDAPEPLTPDEAAAIAEAELSRGERVPPETIHAFWRSHGL
jgi:hypothetical protein